MGEEFLPFGNKDANQSTTWGAEQHKPTLVKSLGDAWWLIQGLAFCIMNSHCFSVDLANEVGLEGAIIMQHFYTWYECNSDNDEMIKDGHIWFFLSRKSILGVFTYLTEKKVRNTIERLIEQGYVIKGDYNKSSFKKATWYTITPKGLSLFKRASRLAERANDWPKGPQEYRKENIEIEKRNNIEESVKEENPNFVSNPMILTEQELSEARQEGAAIPSRTIIPRKKTIDEREKDFATKVMTYDYTKEMLENFITYWTQKLSDNGNKMLFEAQKAFEIGKRLATWHRNDKARNRSYIQEYKEKNEKKKTPWENLGVTEEYYNKFIK